MNKLISIIVPVFKVESLLDKCMVSIVNQTYSHLEIILVEDGSSDCSASICDTWAQRDSRIIVVHQCNQGVSHARNVGLCLYGGDYVAFVDSDDWVERNYIGILLKEIVRQNSDISACNVDFITEDGERIPEFTYSGHDKVCTAKEAFEDLMCGIGFRATPWNKLYSREVISDIKFPENRKHEDEFFSNQVIHSSKRLTYTNRILYHYLQRSSSWMHTNSLEHLDALVAHLERVQLFQNCYKELYVSDKVNFCIACINFYLSAHSDKLENNTAAKRRIKELRGKIKFTTKEFLQISLKEKLYVTGSSRYMISIICYLKTIREAIMKFQHLITQREKKIKNSRN